MTMTTEYKSPAHSPSIFANSRNTIVLNGTNSGFISLRIQDPKQADLENDVCVRTMLHNVPQVSQLFQITDKLGEGTFSKVYKAKLKRTYLDQDSEEVEEYALKYIIPIVKPCRIAKELRFLRDLGGLSNIIPIKTCFFNAGHTVIVMPIVEHDKFLNYLQSMDIAEMRDYMRNLLIALERVHAHGIIHRDIKPSNFLYCRETRQYALVDFGLSQSERELKNSISYYTTTISNRGMRTSSGESKVRKNLEPKFGKTKRSFEEIEHTPNDENAGVRYKRAKRNPFVVPTTEAQQSSVFYTPVTPGNVHEMVFVPSTPTKLGRTPLGEDRNLLNSASSRKVTIPETPEKGHYQYKTPTKSQATFYIDANKTPVKQSNQVMVVDTPPKAVSKQIHFTPPACSQSRNVISNRNVHTYTTPKVSSRVQFQRVANVKKILQPELSNAVPNSNRTERQYQSNSGRNNSVLCDCIDKNAVCHDCLSKPELNVPRAGTPGFRAPEVLLRCQEQNTKIDIWSTGVIFACLLSGRYPFFRCTDDITCLAEITTVLGTSAMSKAASALGKTLVISRNLPALDLKEVCTRLRCSITEQSLSSTSQSSAPVDIITDFRAPNSVYDLLSHLLDPNPFTRYSASEALSHPFFMEPLPVEYLAPS